MLDVSDWLEPCVDKVNIQNEKKFNINPHTNSYCIYYNLKVPFVINEIFILVTTNIIHKFCNLFITEIFEKKNKNGDPERP